MSCILLQPPELDTETDTELSYLQTKVPSISIAHENGRARHVIEIHPCHEVTQNIKEDHCCHPAPVGVADTPLACDSITPHVLELGGGHVPGPLVDKSGWQNIATGSDGVGPGDVLLAAPALVVLHACHPNSGQDPGVLGTSCQCSLVLKWIHIFRFY